MQTTNDTLIPLKRPWLKSGRGRSNTAIFRPGAPGRPGSIHPGQRPGQPAIVFAENGHYRLISGERRWRALCAWP